MTTDATLARFMARPKESGDGRRSEAYVWLRARFEKLEPMLRRKPGWRGLAEDMASGGIKGGSGKPLTDHAVMRIWSRVRQDVEIEEPGRMEATQTAMQQKGLQPKSRARVSGRGANANLPPPVVTAPAPRPPVPSYPPPVPLSATPPLPHAPDLRPHEELSEAEREAYADAQILRLRRRFAEASGHDPDEVR